MKSKLLVLGIALLVVAGCEKSSPTATNEPAAKSGKPKIVYIAKSSGNPYFEPLTQGLKKAAEENGCEAKDVSPESADATSQLPIIKDQIQQNVAAIVISPNSPDALNPVLDEARKKGIPVITVDSDLTGNETHREVGVAPVDPVAVGKTQVELMGSLIGYKGKFAILSATSDAPNQRRWIEEMKKELAANPKLKEMTLVETVYGNDEPQKSLTEAEALLTKYPDLKGILAPTAVGIVSCAQAVETAKKASTVAVTGLGIPSQMKRFIENGTVKSFALWDPYDEGYLAGTIAAKMAKKELKADKGVKLTAGKLGEKEILEKGIVLTGPPLTFTKDNIGNYKF